MKRLGVHVTRSEQIEYLIDVVSVPSVTKKTSKSDENESSYFNLPYRTEALHATR